MGRSKKSTGSGKHRCFVFVLYPESQRSAIEYAQVNFPCAWCLHDKDTYTQDSVVKWLSHNQDKQASDCPFAVGDLKKPHIHFLVKFSNPRSCHGVAHELGVTDNVICVCDSESASYAYLSHKNDPDKAQYDDSAVYVHDYDALDDSDDGYLSEEDQAKILLTMPLLSTVSARIEWACGHGCWPCFSKRYAIWKDVQAEQSFKRSKESIAALDSEMARHAAESLDFMRPEISPGVRGTIYTGDIPEQLKMK